MSRRAQENLVSLLLLALFGGIIVLCQDFGPRARMIPLPLAVFGIVLTLLQLLWQNLRSAEELQMDMISVEPAGGAAEKPKKGAGTGSWRQEAAAFGIVAALVAGVMVIGLLPAVFIFTWVYFGRSGYCSWRAGLCYTVVFIGAVYLMFVVALQMQPYHGLLAPLFT